MVPKDGYVKKDGLPTQFSTSADGSHMTDPVQRRVYTLPASEGDATTLTLWAKPSKQAVVIDLETGEATIHTVELEIDGENTRVLLDGGMT